jgi:prevent-host-death family protein
METTAVADLKARLSRYLRKVKGGDEVLITERGVPIARIVPLVSGTQRAARRQRLTNSGAIRPGRGSVRKALLKAPAGDPIGADVLAALLAERDEGR